MNKFFLKILRYILLILLCLFFVFEVYKFNQKKKLENIYKEFNLQNQNGKIADSSNSDFNNINNNIDGNENANDKKKINNVIDHSLSKLGINNTSDNSYNSLNNSNVINDYGNIGRKNLNSLYFKYMDLNAIGTIEIEKLKYKGIVFEGTNNKSLKYGVGHFKSSPIMQGNVCLAGHNYKNIWSNLYKLENGDIIKYNCKLGSRKYMVFINKQIDYKDVSVLCNTQDNIITLITCVRNIPNKRICVQAMEIN